MRYRIDLDMERCISCGACAVACMDQHDTDLAKGDPAFRWVLRLEEETDERVHYQGLSMACMHCEDAACVTGCPVGCLSKDAETGMTVVDAKNCIGCHSCAMACPYGAPHFGPDGKIAKCDGCAERMKRGYLPACVRVCPMDALVIRTEEEETLEEKTSEETGHQMLLELCP